MLTETRISKSTNVSVARVDIKAEATDESGRSTTVVLPPIQAPRSQGVHPTVEVSQSATPSVIGNDELRRELRSMLRQYERFSTSETYLSRVSTLQQLCGQLDEAVVYAQAAAGCGKSAYFSYLVGERLLSAQRNEAASNVFEKLAGDGHLESRLRLTELAIGQGNLDVAERRLQEALGSVSGAADWRVHLLAGTLALAMSSLPAMEAGIAKRLYGFDDILTRIDAKHTRLRIALHTKSGRARPGWRFQIDALPWR